MVDQNVQYGIFGCDGYLFFFFSNLVFLANGYSSSGLANKKCVYVIKLHYWQWNIEVQEYLLIAITIKSNKPKVGKESSAVDS